MMLWFKKKKADVKQIADLQKEVSKEVQRHNEIKKEVIREATVNGERFKNTVIQNGFTLRIHVAAGRRH